PIEVALDGKTIEARERRARDHLSAEDCGVQVGHFDPFRISRKSERHPDAFKVQIGIAISQVCGLYVAGDKKIRGAGNTKVTGRIDDAVLPRGPCEEA